MSIDPHITDLDACALSRAIHARELSCREVMTAYLARIHRINPRANALVNLAPDDGLLAQAEACDAELTRDHSRGWLHGQPQAIKDTGHAIGFPTTYGCTLLKDAVATQDSVMTARMKAAGAIVIAKTNMPELGLGSHTFNDLFGATGNAWDAEVSAGGSSGGAAVALAQRLLPVADGSDFMGSLRNPAAWANLFGMRPSQGRVPFWPAADTWVAQLGTEGPMARTVADLARLLSTQAGFDARVPLSIAEGPQAFAVPSGAAALDGLRGLRVGWLGDLQGHLPMDAGLLPVCEQALARLAAAGAVVEPMALGFSTESLWDAWLVWRRALVAPKVAALLKLPGAREQIKPEALWEHRQALGLHCMDFMAASEVRTAFYQHLLGLFKRFDVLALPGTQVWPFPIGQRWPRQIAGRTMDTYHRWMEVTLYATFAGLPAISVPAGFHANGRWPAGLQLIGRPQGDGALLRVAAGCEAASGELLARRPLALA
ncbi:MAG: amidase [Burkholderiales bacterium RIFCSPHIGHO2_12_FULL_69_20]|nr:MAG: amidase [Burkholderiales bacterium RIFCSPHIGHO2_12_FULL_69_20]